MTDEDIIIEIAKLDGFEYKPSWLKQPEENWPLDFVKIGSTPDCYSGFETIQDLPAYLTSRDAILSVIQKQSKTTQINVVISVWQASCINHDDSWTTEDIVDIIFCTPKEYCVALLKVKRKWKE